VKIVLVRHGESEGNAKGLYIGGTGSYDLTQNGRKQMNNAASFIKNLYGDHTFSIYSSPTVRAFSSAKILSHKLGTEVVNEPRLMEINLGEIEGMTHKHVKEFDPQILKDFSEDPENLSIPNGENFLDVQQRALSFLYDKVDEEDILVCVSHSIVIRTILVHALGLDLKYSWALSPSDLVFTEPTPFKYEDDDIPLGSVSVMEYKNGVFEVLEIGKV